MQHAGPVLQNATPVLPTALPVNPDQVTRPTHAHGILSNQFGFYSLPKVFETREVYKTLAMGEVYEPRTLRFLMNMAGEGDVVTGGAFVGDFLPALSGAMAPDAMIHTFEPNPIAYTSALHTIALNDLRNVVMSHVAVGNKPGSLPLKIARDNGESLAGSARLVETDQEGQTIPVPVTRLDDLVPADRHVSVLHLDIEGFERPALFGARGLIQRCRPIIVLEAAKPRVKKQYVAMMQKKFEGLNYRFGGTFERNVFLVSDAS